MWVSASISIFAIPLREVFARRGSLKVFGSMRKLAAATSLALALFKEFAWHMRGVLSASCGRSARGDSVRECRAIPPVYPIPYHSIVQTRWTVLHVRGSMLLLMWECLGCIGATRSEVCEAIAVVVESSRIAVLTHVCVCLHRCVLCAQCMS